MSEEDEIFLERSFQRTMIVSIPALPLPFPLKRDDIPGTPLTHPLRSSKSSFRTLPLRRRYGVGPGRYATPTPSSASWSRGPKLSCSGGRATSTSSSTRPRKCSPSHRATIPLFHYSTIPPFTIPLFQSQCHWTGRLADARRLPRVITYWENFSVHAFENTTQNFFQPTKLSLANRGGGEQGHVACSACFTIRRDVFDLPSVVIGQFLPIPAE